MSDSISPREFRAAEDTGDWRSGGRIVSDAGAPEWWTLTDPEGNEVDLAPWRDGSPWKA